MSDAELLNVLAEKQKELEHAASLMRLARERIEDLEQTNNALRTREMDLMKRAIRAEAKIVRLEAQIDAHPLSKIGAA